MTLQSLGLPSTATVEDVRTRYKQLAQTMHPDKGGTPEGFQQLQQWRDEAVVEIMTPTNCPTCAGSGSQFHGSGFAKVKFPCEECGGTGKAKRN